MLTKHTCKNGLRIVSESIPTVRSVSIGIWVGTGSNYEDINNNGISHFIEHMFFKGTKKRHAQEIAEVFDSIGGQVNAFTSKEYTCYYARVLDSHSELAIEVLADMFFNSIFAEEELLKEKSVVLEEIKMYEDTPDDIVHDLLIEASYKRQSLAYPILGTRETLKSFNKAMIKEYMNKYYRPDNIVISIAGNVSADIIKVIESYFGNFTKEENLDLKEAKQIKFYKDFKFQSKNTEQAHLCFGYEGVKLGSDRAYEVILLNNILGGSMSSRLFQEIREQKGLAYSVFSYHSSFLDSGLLTIYAGTSLDQLESLATSLNKSLLNLKNFGISEKELKNTKEQMKGSLMLSLESTSSRMSRNGKNELLLKKHRSLDEVIERINMVSIKSLNEEAQTMFNNPPSLALISPSNNFPDYLIN